MAGAAVIQGSFPHGMAHIRAQQPVQRQPNHRASPTVLTVQLAQAPPLPVHGGQPLTADVRQRMESVFAASFADVRIHVGPQASGFLFRLRGSFDVVEYPQLQANTDYDILVNLQAEYEVRTSAVGGGSVTFSSVT